MKKISLFWTFLLLLAGRNSLVFAQIPISSAEINPEYQKWINEKTAIVSISEHAMGLIPNPLKIHTELPSYLKEIFITKVSAAPSFDLRNTGALTSVKDQGNCGSCWTFATFGSIESSWLTAGKGTYDLSEDNLNTCHPPFLWAPCAGGNEIISSAYLTRGSGPISETDDPYSDTHTNVDCPAGLIPQGVVTSTWFLPASDPDLIKNWLVQYGALYTTFYWAGESYNGVDYTYYHSGSDATNHAVTLVGWDDNKVTAGGTGAWIIKNSWGTGWGEDGYFYIAYQDATINSSLALFKDYITYNPDLTISNYSESGWVGNNFGWGTETADALVKFIPDGDIQLAKIGTYTVYPGSVVTIEVYDNFDGNSSLTGLLGSISAQTCNFTGYHSFDLSSPIDISSGNDYFIKINYQTTGYNYPVPFEQVITNFSNPPISTGVFWTKSTTGSNWISLDSYAWDPCVYTYSISGAAGKTQGNTTIYNSTSTTANRRAMPVTFTESGTIQSISIYHNGGTGNVYLGVYADASASPAARLGVTPSTIINSAAGWQTVSLTSPVSVTSGQKVWLAWVFETNPGVRYITGTPARAQSTALWSGGMPTTFGTASYANYKYSVYCTYTAGADAYLTVSPTTVSIGSASGSGGTFIISSNTTWNITDDGSWLDVSPDSGTNDGTITVTANSANTGTGARSATVIITGTGVSSQIVTVTQEGQTGGKTLGNTTVYNLSSTTANRRALPVTFTEAGTIQSISIYHNGGTGNVYLGVYADASASPAERLGVTPSTIINSAAGWQTITLTSPVSVSSGQTVWLSWVFQTNPGIRYIVGTPARAESPALWSGGMPTTFGSASYANYKYSVYCNYTPGGTATHTLGNTTVYSSSSTTANRRALPVTFTEAGTINSVSIYHNGGTGSLLLGVYSDASGAPVTRLGLTPSTVINSTAGWQTIALTSPVSVSSGQTVWLSWVFQTNPGIRYIVGTPARAESPALWSGGMPATFGSATFGNYKYSVYCTYTTGAPTLNLDVSPTSISLGLASGSSGTFGISSNTSWSITDNASWLSVSPISGTNNATITVTATSANTGASPRSATVTIAGTGVANKTVTVTQVAGGSILGNTTVYSSSSMTANRRALPVTFTEAGTIQSVSIYHDGGTGGVLLGVYSDVSGAPTARLGVTPSTGINSTAGWQTISLTNPVSVMSGQTVWLVWVFETNPGVRYITGTPARAQSTALWSGGMPTTFGPASYANYKYSIYCTYTTEAGIAKSSGDQLAEESEKEMMKANPNTADRRKEKVQIYPNPTESSVTFKWETLFEERLMLTIYNNVGIPVKTVQIEPDINEIQVDLGGIKNGIYLYELRTIKNGLIINRSRVIKQ